MTGLLAFSSEWASNINEAASLSFRFIYVCDVGGGRGGAAWQHLVGLAGIEDLVGLLGMQRCHPACLSVVWD